jgi:hypothetical protein
MTIGIMARKMMPMISKASTNESMAACYCNCRKMAADGVGIGGEYYNVRGGSA